MALATTPVRAVPLAFLGAIGVGTCLLKLPFSTAPGHHTSWLDAAFVAVSAICVNGLTPVDTATQWTTFGHVVLVVLFQVGGFGIMTLAALLALIAGRRLGLTASLLTSSETHARLGDVRRLPLRIATTMMLTELVVAAVVAVRLHLAYGRSWPSAAWHGFFHAVTAFTNSGFSLYSDNLTRFRTDPFVLLPLCAAVVAGGLGYPVFLELTRPGRLLHVRRWSAHARLTVFGTLALLVLGFFAFVVVEWRNPATIGDLGTAAKLLNGVGGSVFPRTAGFQTVDYAQVRPETLLVHYGLMFVGGSSGGTAGGIKVGTFFLLAYVIWSEVRGEPDVEIGHRAIGSPVVRQALAVALLSIGLIAVGTFLVLSFTRFRLDVVLFETIAAFGGVGLSAGLTPLMPPQAKIVLMVIMYCGRVGPVSTAAAMAATRRTHRYRLPEEEPLVG